MTPIEAVARHYWGKLSEAFSEYNRINRIKTVGWDPHELVRMYNELLEKYKQDREDARRYRWLRDNKHLDIWWSVEGPEDRCDNIDADIDAAIEQQKERVNAKD